MINIILIGNGGHSKVIQSIVSRSESYRLVGILDQNISEYSNMNTLFLDNIENLDKYRDHGKFLIAIGDNRVRHKLVDELNLSDQDCSNVIDDTAIIGHNVSIGVGTVVMPGAIVNPDTTIGKHSIINTGSIVEHDNTIGDYTHISPGATLAGTVSIGEFVHIGSGATIIPNIKVMNESIIGAGAVVIEDIKEKSLAVGVPAKVVKEIK